jgi:hypothetical protein
MTTDTTPNFLSVDEPRSFFGGWTIGNTSVLCDGKVLELCQRADRVGGWADCLAKHPQSGVPYVDPKTDSVACVRWYGKIEFVIAPEELAP